MKRIMAGARTACLECILSFGVQRLFHEGLNRPRGLTLLDALLSGSPSHSGTEGRMAPEHHPRKDAPILSNAERITRAKERNRRRRK